MPETKTESFANECLKRMKMRKVTPTEMDILFVLEDESLMSATYKQRGFAVSLTFENYETACPPDKIDKVLRELSAVCADIGGRIHLVKNLRADKDCVRRMFRSTIGAFEAIKHRLDPQGILRNLFYDKIFEW